MTEALVSLSSATERGTLKGRRSAERSPHIRLVLQWLPSSLRMRESIPTGSRSEASLTAAATRANARSRGVDRSPQKIRWSSVAQLWHTCCLKTAQDGTSHLT